MIAKYIDSILKIDEIHANGLNNKKAVRRNNRLADRIRKIASDIETKHPELKTVFYEILFHEKASVRCWAAHHILEVMNYDNECRKNALKEILYVSEHDSSIHRLGNKMWLKDWFTAHPDDKELL